MSNGHVSRHVNAPHLGDIIPDAKLIEDYYAICRSRQLLSDDAAGRIVEVRQAATSRAAAIMEAYNIALSQLSTLARHLNKLEAEHRTAVQCAKSCSKLLQSTDIRALPVEVVSEVFRHCLPAQPYPNPKEAPLLLCQVSSAWRKIAHSLPFLWSNISIPRRFRLDTGNPMFGNDSDLLRRVWLTHCRDKPLSLSVTNHSVGWLKAVLPSITNEISHLTIFARSTEHHDVLDVFKMSSSDTLSRLSSLRLVDHVSPAFSTRIPHLPNLRKLSFDSSGCAALPFAWGQLTHLDCLGSMTRLNVPEWRSLLSQCLSLRHGTFTIYSSPSQTPEPPLVHVYLLELQYLWIDVYGEGGMMNIFQWFYFPCLKTFHVRGTSPHIKWRIEDGIHSRARVYPYPDTLDRLSVSYVNFNSGDAFLVDSCTAIKDLELLVLTQDGADVVSKITSLLASNQQPGDPQADSGGSIVVRRTRTPELRRLRLGLTFRDSFSMIRGLHKLLQRRRALDVLRGDVDSQYPRISITLAVYFPLEVQRRVQGEMSILRRAVQAALGEGETPEWGKCIRLEVGGYIRGYRQEKDQQL